MNIQGKYYINRNELWIKWLFKYPIISYPLLHLVICIVHQQVYLNIINYKVEMFFNFFNSILIHIFVIKD